VAIANTYLTPTGDFPRQPDLDLSMGRQAKAVAASAETLSADLSAIATRMFGDAVGANMMALGMAWQCGRVPLSEAAILRAIELNGAAVAMNTAAFRWGRALANDPDAAATFVERREPAEDASLDAVVARRERHLTAYQNRRLAERYRGLVDRIAAAEARAAPGSHALTEIVARAYHKLLAIKDEYEVARLHTDADFLDGLSRVAEGGRRVFHLAPPLLARRDPVTGHPGKMRFGPWIVPVFRGLARMKVLRGTPLDVFGWTAERQMERRLITEYEALLARMVDALSRENLALAMELAALPLEIRGFGHVKLGSVKMAYERRDELLAGWPEPPLKTKVPA
jgi:indolepyruvate ferredoxin oxidoreductase